MCEREAVTLPKRRGPAPSLDDREAWATSMFDLAIAADRTTALLIASNPQSWPDED